MKVSLSQFSTLPIDLSNLSKWAEQWLVKLNPDKTDIMVFSVRNRDFNPNLNKEYKLYFFYFYKGMIRSADHIPDPIEIAVSEKQNGEFHKIDEVYTLCSQPPLQTLGQLCKMLQQEWRTIPRNNV
jgi:hypothetical protein